MTEVQVSFPESLKGQQLKKYLPEDVCLLFRENGLKIHCQQVLKLGITGSDLLQLGKGDHQRMRIANVEHRELISKVCKAVLLQSAKCRTVQNDVPVTPSPVRKWNSENDSIQTMQQFTASDIHNEIATSLKDCYRYSCSRSRSPSVRNLIDDRLLPFTSPSSNRSIPRRDILMTPPGKISPPKPAKTWAEKVAECTQSPCRRGLLSAALSAETTHCVNSKPELQKGVKKPRKFGPEHHLTPNSLSTSVLSGELIVEERSKYSPRYKNPLPVGGNVSKPFGVKCNLAKRRVGEIGLAPKGEERKRIAMGWAAHK